MVILDFPDIKKTLFLPENLSECDRRQYADISKLIYCLNSKEINYFEFRILALYALLNLEKPKSIPKTIDENDIKWQQVFLLSEKIDSFFNKTETPEGVKIETKLGYFNNPLPHIKMFNTYFGPKDGFEDVMFGQYVDGLEEYIYFSQTGDVEALRTLFSIFYLGRNENYQLKNAKKKANEIFRHIDIRYLYGFYLYFTSMQEYILGGELMVMGKSIDLSIIYQETGEEKKSDIPGIGMHSVLHDIAESGVFGSYNGVRETNMWQILLRLYELKKKNLDDLKTQKKNES